MFHKKNMQGVERRCVMEIMPFLLMIVDTSEADDFAKVVAQLNKMSALRDADSLTRMQIVELSEAEVCFMNMMIDFFDENPDLAVHFGSLDYPKFGNTLAYSRESALVRMSVHSCDLYL